VSATVVSVERLQLVADFLLSLAANLPSLADTRLVEA
jgi:hypothetical protein